MTFSPYPQVLGVGTTLSYTKFSPTVSGGEAVASTNSQHSFVLHCPLVRVQNLPPTQAQLPRGSVTPPLFPAAPRCHEAQVCEGSAELQLDGQASGAEAWAARSW